MKRLNAQAGRMTSIATAGTMEISAVRVELQKNRMKIGSVMAMSHYHKMEHVLFPPPRFEAFFADKGSTTMGTLEEAYVMICRGCWQIEFHAYKLEGDTIRAINETMNKGVEPKPPHIVRARE